MTRKQTSAKVSKLAARYLRMSKAAIVNMMDEDRMTLVADVKALAASCLSQDEVKGAKPTVFKASGKFTKPKKVMSEEEAEAIHNHPWPRRQP